MSRQIIINIIIIIIVVVVIDFRKQYYAIFYHTEISKNFFSMCTKYSLKGTVHHQKIFFKYVMLRTVTKNSTLIITKYT